MDREDILFFCIWLLFFSGLKVMDGEWNVSWRHLETELSAY